MYVGTLHIAANVIVRTHEMEALWDKCYLNLFMKPIDNFWVCYRYIFECDFRHFYRRNSNRRVRFNPIRPHCLLYRSAKVNKAPAIRFSCVICIGIRCFESIRIGFRFCHWNFIKWKWPTQWPSSPSGHHSAREIRSLRALKFTPTNDYLFRECFILCWKTYVPLRMIHPVASAYCQASNIKGLKIYSPTTSGNVFL